MCGRKLKKVWESILGCRGSSLKRGVGEVWKSGGVGKYGGGVRKCVADVGESEKCWGRCREVC